MTASPPTNETIFHAARNIPDIDRRREYIREACGADAARIDLLEAMLGAADAPDSLLDCPAGSEATLDQPVGARPGDVIGPYKLLELIGEGGFGVVYMAEQTRPLRRKVALKVIKPGMDTHQVVARFEAERQALALMDHPNIAKVLDAGATDQGRPYFVMELVRGIPITQFCDDKRLTARERLGLFISVCQAIQHAHQKGIIHRDLKPSNVLVTLHDAVPVPKVIDFGVAKALGQQLTEKTLFTGFAQMVGTPLYMSPEQAELSGLDADTRTDIYSLGVLLYELLTGTTPLDKDRLNRVGYEELRQIIREEEPPRPSTRISTLGADAVTVSASRGSEPRKLSALVRGELDWIVMKCLDKDRNRRYETAAALVADVQRYLTDEPVQACPPSTWYRSRKFARRNKAVLATASVLGLAGVVSVTSLVMIASEKQARLAAQQAEARHDDDRKKADENARRENYFHLITLAHRDLALNSLAACPEELRGWEWYYLMRLCTVEPVVIQEKKAVHGVAFSPDGERLASAGVDGDVRILNSRTGKLDRTIEKAHTDSVVCVTFHPEGKHLATAGADRLVKVWDLTTDPAVKVFEGPCDAIRTLGGAYTVAYTVAFSPPNGRLVAAGNDGDVNVWDWKNWKKGDRPLHTFSGYSGNSIPVAFSPDGRILAAGGGGQEGQRLWDMETGELFRPPLPGRGFPVNALAFSPDGGRLASAGLDRMVYVHDTTTPADEPLSKLIHSGNVLCVAFSRNGRLVASAGEDKTVRVWDATTGREVLGLRGHTRVCTCLAFSPDPDGWRLASASADGTIRIWDATPVREDERQEILTFEKHNDEIRSVAFSPDGQEIASAGHGGLKVWNVATKRVRLDFPGHKYLTWSVAWQPPDGRRIASAGGAGGSGGPSVKVWDAVNEREFLFELPSRAGRPYHAVAFSRDGQYLVTGKTDGRVEVWNAETGGEVRPLGTHEREILGLIFSPDGRWLASASGEGVVKIWDARRLDQIQQTQRIFQSRVPGPSLNVAFSPDGQRLATGGEENTLKVWDVQTGQDLQTLGVRRADRHHGEVYTLAFSPDKDGRWVASAGEDSTVKVWDSHTGKLVRTFRGHAGLVSSLAFSPDGRLLVSGSRDKTVKVWDVSKLEVEPKR
jgi:eukaryotic-like serine/threonine-protein kinase